MTGPSPDFALAIPAIAEEPPCEHLYGTTGKNRYTCVKCGAVDEALCDAFCGDVRSLAGRPEKPARTRPRYSPGFGDFGLEYQPYIFEALDCQRAIGLTLTDSFLMSPTKSVTALIGILDENE